MATSLLEKAQERPRAGLSGFFNDAAVASSMKGMFEWDSNILSRFKSELQELVKDGNNIPLSLEEILGTLFCQIALLTKAFYRERGNAVLSDIMVVNCGSAEKFDVGLLVFKSPIKLQGW